MSDETWLFVKFYWMQECKNLIAYIFCLEHYVQGWVMCNVLGTVIIWLKKTIIKLCLLAYLERA